MVGDQHPAFFHFQSRARAYPSSDLDSEKLERLLNYSFNPALGLIHLLTRLPLLHRSTHTAFNPALGLIHLLTALYKLSLRGIKSFQSRARAYPSSDNHEEGSSLKGVAFQSRARAYPSSDYLRCSCL